MELSKAISYRLSQLLAEKQISSYNSPAKAPCLPPRFPTSSFATVNPVPLLLSTTFAGGSPSKSATFSVLLFLISRILTTTVDSF